MARTHRTNSNHLSCIQSTIVLIVTQDIRNQPTQWKSVFFIKKRIKNRKLAFDCYLLNISSASIREFNCHLHCLFCSMSEKQCSCCFLSSWSDGTVFLHLIHIKSVTTEAVAFKNDDIVIVHLESVIKFFSYPFLKITQKWQNAVNSGIFRFVGIEKNLHISQLSQETCCSDGESILLDDFCKVLPGFVITGWNFRISIWNLCVCTDGDFFESLFESNDCHG